MPDPSGDQVTEQSTPEPATESLDFLLLALRAGDVDGMRMALHSMPAEEQHAVSIALRDMHHEHLVAVGMLTHELSMQADRRMQEFKQETRTMEGDLW